MFLSSPPILTRPGENAPLILYLAVYEKSMSSILVQEGEDGEKSVYFVSKVLKGSEQRYQKIEKLVLTLIITT